MFLQVIFPLSVFHANMAITMFCRFECQFSESINAQYFDFNLELKKKYIIASNIPLDEDCSLRAYQEENQKMEWCSCNNYNKNNIGVWLSCMESRAWCTRSSHWNNSKHIKANRQANGAMKHYAAIFPFLHSMYEYVITGSGGKEINLFFLFLHPRLFSIQFNVL